MRFKEHDVVVLRRSVAGSALEIGAIGAVVNVYEDGKAYEVEFCDERGGTRELLTLEAADLERVVC